MISPIDQQKDLRLPISSKDSGQVSTPLLVSSTNPIDIKLASNPLLSFINENTIDAISQHSQEVLQGKRGVLGFGYSHLAVPFQRGAVVPFEKYLAENLEALAKANNITLIAMESSAEGIDKPVHVMAEKQEEAKKEFVIEIGELAQQYKVDLGMASLVADTVLNEHFNDNHQSVNDRSSKSIDQMAKAVSDALKPWLGSIPGMGRFFEASLNERNSFEEFHAGNLLYQKAKQLGIKMFPIDAPVKEKTKGSLYDEFKLEFGKLWSIAYLLHNKQDLLPQMPEFLKKNKGYQKFIENFKQLSDDTQKQLIESYIALFNEVSKKAKKFDDDREVAMAFNLQNAFGQTEGNVMTAFGSRHTMKLLPEGQTPSVVKQMTDYGIPSISIHFASRDHVIDKATLSLIPESVKPQYLKTECHPSLSNIDLAASYGEQIGKGVKLSQAYDAIVTLPKLAA